MGKSRPELVEGRYDVSMRSRVFLITLFFALGSLVLPLAAHAGGIPFFGPIIPGSDIPGNINAVCPAGWGMLMDVINNIISLLLTIAIVFVAPIMIAYSGFLFVVNPVNPSGKEKAKGILQNTVIGIVIALAGWLIVNAVMAVLYNSTTPVSDGSVLKTWSSLVTSSGNFCLPQAGALPGDTLNQAPMTGVSAGGGVTLGGSAAQCSNGNTACSPSALQAAGFNQTQSNIMSCIAFTESSGNPSAPPYNTTHSGSNSTACGTFQITRTTWNQYASGACSDFSSCMNATCNMKVAQALVSNNGYSDWTCANCNSKAASCVQKYGGQ